MVFAAIAGAKGCIGLVGRVCMGYAGVAKAGEDDKSWSFVMPGVALKSGGRDLGVAVGSSILVKFMGMKENIETGAPSPRKLAPQLHLQTDA